MKGSRLKAEDKRIFCCYILNQAQELKYLHLKKSSKSVIPEQVACLED